jgi:glycosyltransferase involved in cell wall biosynthesis
MHEINLMVLYNTGNISSGKSGSDNRFIEWCKAWANEYGIVLRTIFSGVIAKQKYGNLGFANILLTDKRRRFVYHPIKGIYFLGKMCAKSILYIVKEVDKPENAFIYSVSDFFPDALPAMILKKKSRGKAKLVVGMHHVFDSPLSCYGCSIKEWGIANWFILIYQYALQNILMFFLKDIADLILVSNEYDRRILLEKKEFVPQKVLVVRGALPYDVDLLEIPAVDGQFDVCFLGRNHPVKGIKDFFYVCERLYREGLVKKVAVLGGGFDEIRKHYESSEFCSCFEFPGYVDGTRKSSYLKSSKVMLAPSYFESFGMAILEGLAHGLPVIGYDLEVYREAFSDHLVTAKIHDRKDLLKKTRLALEGHHAPDKRKRAKLLAGFDLKKSSLTILEHLRLLQER